MLSQFWQGLGSELSERWVERILTPAFLFWLGGLGAWAWQVGWEPLANWFLGLDASVQGMLVLGSFLLVALSSGLVQRLEPTVLGLLEGYWPGWLDWLYRLGVRWQDFRLARAERQWQALSRQGIAKLNPAQRRRFVELDIRRRRAPADPGERMPTALGNILRAGELRPRDKYGLDAVICWPRLWLLLPEDVREELVRSRAGLEMAVRVWIWGALFLIWSWMAWWALPVGLLVVLLGYRMALSAAATFADLVESAFDVHRSRLYQALRWPLPANPRSERVEGAKITGYLWRGLDEEHPTFLDEA